MAFRTLSCAAIIARPRAVRRKLCDSGPSIRPISTMVIAITTSSSTSVKPRRTLVMTSSGSPIAADVGAERVLPVAQVVEVRLPVVIGRRLRELHAPVPLRPVIDPDPLAGDRRGGSHLPVRCGPLNQRIEGDRALPVVNDPVDRRRIQ